MRPLAMLGEHLRLSLLGRVRFDKVREALGCGVDHRDLALGDASDEQVVLEPDANHGVDHVVSVEMGDDIGGGMTRWESRARLAEWVLAELVALKDGPRDERYEQRKPIIWQAARDTLKAREEAEGTA